MGIYGDTNQCLWQTEEPIFPLAKEISTSDMPATLRGEKKKKKKVGQEQPNKYIHTHKKKKTHTTNTEQNPLPCHIQPNTQWCSALVRQEPAARQISGKSTSNRARRGTSKSSHSHRPCTPKLQLPTLSN